MVVRALLVAFFIKAFPKRSNWLERKFHFQVDLIPAFNQGNNVNEEKPQENKTRIPQIGFVNKLVKTRLPKEEITRPSVLPSP